jgi:hypothetical protein
MRIAGKVMKAGVALAAAAVLSACANSEQASTGSGKGTSTPPPLPVTTSKTVPPTTATSGVTASGQECKADDVKVAGEFGALPAITIPDTCQPPKTLLIKDLKPGTGAEVKAGNNVLANYHLVTWSDKKALDSSFERGEPYEVKNVGQAQVIQGWNEGLIGIKEGARRLLIVPPDKGYGSRASNGMKANETLVFVIDAVKVT